MDIWIQPCAPCSDLHGKTTANPSHPDLSLDGTGVVKDSRIEEHYICGRCRGVFARILAGSPSRQIWMLLNAGQHQADCQSRRVLMELASPDHASATGAIDEEPPGKVALPPRSVI
jgi:hypothetical protein